MLALYLLYSKYWGRKFDHHELLFIYCLLYFIIRGNVRQLTHSQSCRLGSVARFVVVLNPQGPRFDPGQANYVYRTMLANNLGC